MLRAPVTDGPHETPAFVDESEGRPFLSVDAIQDGELVLDGCRYVAPQAFDEYRKKAAPELDDILMGKAASTGKIARVKTSTPFAIWSPLALIRPAKNRLDSRFLEYVLKSPALQQQIEDLCNSNTQKNIGMGDIPRLAFALPPMQEQERTADFLDEQTARIDALIAEKAQLLQALAESEASQVLAEVTGQTREAPGELSPEKPEAAALPAGWKLPQLARLVSKLTNGFVGPTRDILVPAGVRYLQSLHIKSGQVDFERGEYYVTEDWSQVHLKSVLQVGDVLIVQTGDIGQTAVVTEEFAGCNCHALIIATPRRELVIPEYLELVLRSAYGRAAFNLYATGALHPHLNCSNIRDIRVPLPPLAVQRKIVANSTSIGAAHRKLRSHVEEHIERLREYRSSLISAAVTGQLDISTSGSKPAARPAEALA
nr:restriction endonuclease subunit S [Ramlibacter paludis]